MLPAKILFQLHYTLIQPYLAYCNLVWISSWIEATTPKYSQRKAIGPLRILSRPHQDVHIHTVELFRITDVLTLSQINLSQINEFMYKYKNKLLPPPIFDSYFIQTSDIFPYNIRSLANF